MIWYIALYLAIGVVLAVFLVVEDLPYDVELGDVIIGLPTVVGFWPVVLVCMLLNSHALDRHLFTIGGRRDNQD